MDLYPLLRLAHFVGFVMLGAGLFAVFVSEIRAYRTGDLHRFAEAAWYTAAFYDCLAVPGALLVGLSGLGLVFELGLDFFAAPWLVGMWGLFLFEFVEGNTVTRVQFRRTLRHSRAALAAGRLTERDRAEARTVLAQVTHFLDLPLFLSIVGLGVMRPDRWMPVAATVAAALVAAAILASVVPRTVRPT